MAKVFRAVGTVAGVVATVAAFVPGGQPIAGIAAAVAAVSQIGYTLTASKPGAQGQVSDIVIGANNPQPYLMGRSYSPGVLCYDVGYGERTKKVSNPYRWRVRVFSCCGPVEELEAWQFDFETLPFSGTAATGYYADYYWRDYQLGARPESDALTPQYSGVPDWGSDYKLSGFAAVGETFRWEKKGKRFTGGYIPASGGIWKGVKVYDPRLDSTYPGGSGGHRITDESTWTYSANPALHALAYGYGRYVNGKKVFGIDLGVTGVDAAKIVCWANACDVNGWTLGGTIYEPGDKWNNLKRICEAGACVPHINGGVLTFDYQAPRASLGTVNPDDLADGQITARIGKGWKERINTLIPKYRSEAHQWNYVQSRAVSVASWVAADGEVKEDERQFDLVTNKDQAAQLGMYDLWQRREPGPISFTCKPHMIAYGPGDSLTLAAELGAHPDGAIKVVIRNRSVDPISGTVRFDCEADSDAKHLTALIEYGTAPSTVNFPSAQEMDELNFANSDDSNFTADLTIYTADDTGIRASAT